MRYLVTLQKEIFSNENYETIEPKIAISMLHLHSDDKRTKVWGLDTETFGFDPYTKELFTVQIGRKDMQFCIDCTTVDITLFKTFLEREDLTFILHNAKFDLRFFYHKRIVIKNVYDTYLGERLLYLGYPYGIHPMDLKSLCQKYLDIELDKSVRGAMHYEGLSDRVVIYGCEDVAHLIDLKEAQYEKIKENELEVAIGIENQFVPFLAYMEYSGIKLDIAKWRLKMFSDKKRLDVAKATLDEWILNFGNPKYIKSDNDLFNGYTKKCNINWNSTKQLIPLFEELGFDLKTKDKKTGRLKKSIEANIIELQKKKSDISVPYLEYTKAQKVVSTYGENFIQSINPVSGRIHTQFNQLMDTSRLSCGGTDKDTGQENINFQNIPADDETRACFISESGYSLIDCDYHAQEDFIFTEYSREPQLVAFYNDIERERDGHSFTAKLCFPEELKDIPEEEVKSKRKDLRQQAKSAKFAINYGGSADAISRNLGISLEQGEFVYNSYMKAFPEIRKYFSKVDKEMWQRGYILISPYTGHKAYIYDWDLLKKTESRFNSEFWTKYREVKAKYNYEEAPQFIYEQFANGEEVDERYYLDIVKHFFKRKGASERQAKNYPIQGCAAQITKIASIFYFKHLIEKDLLFKVWIPNEIHDEIMVEAPDSIVEEEAKVLQECMERAGAMFIKVVKLTAVPDIAKYWKH